MKKQITFKLLMLSSLIAGIFFLNGCATHHLWWKERDQDLDKYRSIGKAGQIYITDDSENEKNLRLCIPFDVKKWGKIDGDILFPPFEKGFFVTNVKKSKTIYISKNLKRTLQQEQILKSILNSNFNLLSIDVTNRYDGDIWFHLIFDIPLMTDNEIVFEKKEINLPNNIKFSKYTSEMYFYGDAYARHLVQKKWRSKFECPMPRILSAAWIDSQGHYTFKPNFNEKTGILYLCKENKPGIKYVKLMFDVIFFNYFTNIGSGEEKFFIYSPLPGTVDSKFLKQLDITGWKPLIDKSNVKELKLDFPPPSHKYKEQVYKYPPAARVLGSPFSIAFDIITFPIQAIIFLFWR